MARRVDPASFALCVPEHGAGCSRGSDREPPGGWSDRAAPEEADNVFFSCSTCPTRGRHGARRRLGGRGSQRPGPAGPPAGRRSVDKAERLPRFVKGDVRSRPVCVHGSRKPRDLHALHPMPRRRTVIYATRDPADALEVVATNRIAVLRRGRIVSTVPPCSAGRRQTCAAHPPAGSSRSSSSEAMHVAVRVGASSRASA